MRYALAVDGGNSKTDLAVVREDGEVAATARGAGSSPYHLGVEGSLDVIERLLHDALATTRLRRPLDAAELLLAGVDFPEEEDAVLRAVERRGWAVRASVDNDTFAVLRAGTNSGWGVAVVCGAGINCIGIAPDGRQARFPALGWTTGDWGGGGDVGQEAVYAAARSEDGRGPKTTLEHAVPAHFGFASPHELAEALHFRRLEQGRTMELAPVVLVEAAHDEVAAEIVARLAHEVVALARVAIARLGLEHETVEVMLGGGLLQRANGTLLAAIDAGLAQVGPNVRARPTVEPAIVGAALLALDTLGANCDAHDRLRRTLGESNDG
ncbi:MAG TPA: BadF/BadG/BcrA/BcrD ATPase family protein [Gaiellaceae bacterium]|nr:BadF/BadG/BcrA/BcrD ATPase family protein [Gaiellaceae bacterium]